MGSPVLWSLRPTRQGALHGTEVRAKSSVLLYHIIFILYLITGGMENGTDIGAQTSFPTSVKRVNLNLIKSSKQHFHTNKESHNFVPPAAEVAAPSLPEATTAEPPVSSPSSCTAVTLPAASWVGFLIS